MRGASRRRRQAKPDPYGEHRHDSALGLIRRPATDLRARSARVTALQAYRRLMDLLQESGLSKTAKLQRASAFAQEGAAVKAIWEPKPKTKRGTKEVTRLLRRSVYSRHCIVRLRKRPPAHAEIWRTQRVCTMRAVLVK
jgi:hypothetical protein